MMMRSPRRFSRAAFGLLFALFAVLPLSGCDDRASSVTTATAGGAPGPRISFPTRRVDFGTVTSAKTLTGQFEFTNEGDAPLHIQAVTPSCGCTAAEPSKRVYEPGEAGTIDFEWELEGFGGQTKTITVISDGPGGQLSPIDLYIGAIIDPLIRALPTRVHIMDGQLGVPTSEVIHLTSNDPNVVIQQVQAGHQAIGVQVLDEAPEGWLPPATTSLDGPPFERWLRVSLNERATWGQNIGSVVIRALGQGSDDAQPRIHELTLSVSARMYGEVVADDDMFRIEVVKPGRGFERSLVLSSRSGEPFTITDVSIPGVPFADGQLTSPDGLEPELTVRFERVSAPGRTVYRILLKGESNDYLGRVGGYVLIETDVPGEAQLRVPFGGWVREQ